LLHTADWQLGKEFGSFGDDAGALLRAQRIKTVRAVAELATTEKVDLVLVAGDVFESNLVKPEVITGMLGALRAFSGDWVILPGNHDYASEPSIWDRLRGMGFPANVHLATTEGPALLLQNGTVAVLCAPLVRRHESVDKTAIWNDCETPAGCLRIGLAHGSVPGFLPAEAEPSNPIAADRAAAARLDYLALGDWHGTMEIAPNTWYCGTPESDNFVANDCGNVLLIEVEAGCAPRIERRAIGHFQWRRKRAVLQSAGDVEQLGRELSTPADAQQIVRLELSGSLDVAGRALLDRKIEWWGGQFAALDVRDSQLTTMLRTEDFAAMQPPGYVEAAAQKLGVLHAADPPGDQAEVAAKALELLYRYCSALGTTP